MINGLEIERTLDLRNAADQEALKLAAKPIKWVADLINENLDYALTYLTDPNWFKVYSGGLIGFKISQNRHFGFDVARLMLLGNSLNRLKNCRNFDLLLANLEVLTQIKATVFEARAAAWCMQRDIHRDLELYPSVLVKGHIKIPDFLWKTSLGCLMVECKTTNFSETKFALRLQYVSDLTLAEYDKYSIWKGLRLNVNVETLIGNVAKATRKVIFEAATAVEAGDWHDQTFQEGSISAFVVKRGLDLDVDERYAWSSFNRVETAGVPVPHTAAILKVQLPAEKYRQLAVNNAFKDALTQLSEEQSNAIFIEVDRCTQGMQQRLSQAVSSRSQVPWASLWLSGECAWASWHEGQQFDDRVLVRDTVII